MGIYNKIKNMFNRVPETVTINISRAWITKPFNCTPDFIRKTCNGKCCEGAKKIMVSVSPDEVKQHKRGMVKDGMLKPKSGFRLLCPYKNDNGLCDVHLTPQKPFGCIVSPFTVNKNKTLIVRHRYIHMPCYGQGAPAYITFRASLVLLFGEAETDSIITQIESGSGAEIKATMKGEIHAKLMHLDNIKKVGK